MEVPNPKNLTEPKIAVCLSGFLRTWEYTKYSLYHILCKGIEPDLFVHTYYQNYHEHSAGQEDIKYTEKEIRQMFDGFNLKKLVIEDREELFPKTLEYSKKFSHCPNYPYRIPESSDKNSPIVPLGSRIIEQFRKIEECNNLKKEYEQENRFTYDIVVRTRMDVLYFEPADWKSIKECKVYTERGTTGGFPHDCVTFGTSKTIDIISSRYSKLENMILSSEICKSKACGCEKFLPIHDICAHGTLKLIAEINNIEIQSGLVSAIVQRDKNRFHIPGKGTVDLRDTDSYLKKIIINSLKSV